MGEKGAEVAPAPATTTPPPADLAAIAGILGNFVDSAVPDAPSATARPMGELGSELSGVLPSGLSPTIPNLTPGSTPTLSGSGLGDLTPTVGTGTAGVQPPGITPAGVQPPGITPAGVQPPGITPAGVQPPVSMPSELQPPGIEPLS